MIKVENVSKDYELADGTKVTALKNVSFEVKEGEILGIMGKSGSGKTTLLRLLKSSLSPFGKLDGSIYFNGKLLADCDTKEQASGIGFVMQNPDNQIVATIVEDDVAFGPENLGVPREEIRKRVDEALKIVDMYDYRLHEPHKLSGGQKQRVAIAGAIAMQTKCIVLDEPTAMLDPKGRKEVLNALKRLKEELGMTIILITHFMDEAVNADRVVVMNDGVVVFDGTPEEVFKNTEELKRIGLSVPKPLELALELKKEGYDLGTKVLTEDLFLEAFKKLQ